MIVGLGAAALQGGVIATDDLDIWVEALGRPEFKAAVEAAGGIYIPPIELRPPTIFGPGLDGIDLVIHMSGLGSFADEYQYMRKVPLENILVPVLSVQRIILSKRSANRPKDRAVLPILEELARTIDEMESDPRKDIN